MRRYNGDAGDWQHPAVQTGEWVPPDMPMIPSGPAVFRGPPQGAPPNIAGPMGAAELLGEDPDYLAAVAWLAEREEARDRVRQEREERERAADNPSEYAAVRGEEGGVTDASDPTNEDGDPTEGRQLNGGGRKRSALLPGGSTRKWRRIREQVLLRDRAVCAYCGGQANTVDHIVPRKAGGMDVKSNLVAACTHCNQLKLDKLLK